MSFHVLNAFEEDDGKLIKIISCDYYDFDISIISTDSEKPGE